MKINPLDDRVVVRPNEAEETTAGGIVLPGSAAEKLVQFFYQINKHIFFVRRMGYSREKLTIAFTSIK